MCFEDEPACIPKTCADKGAECGTVHDDCGGIVECAECPAGSECTGHTCGCVPHCGGAECGDDGCGGTCGSCNNNQSCDDGECVTAYCTGRCGIEDPTWAPGYGTCYCDDACFGFGDCCPDVCSTCVNVIDQCCDEDCSGKQCGDDGCGGSCGSCGVGSSCQPDGMCSTCTPSCSGAECGPDGCGGSCGTCAAGTECEGSQCQACEPQCGGKQCGSDLCGGVCGECDEGDVCTDAGHCVSCVPDCAGKLCGDNGCGGSCGDCGGIDCDNLPSGPFTLKKLSGPMASEDLAFDDQGNVIGSNDQAIFKSQYNSSPQIWIPNINFRAGLRYLPSGDLMVNNDNTGQLLRFTPDGTKHVVLNNLKYPNGMTVDYDNYAYVTEHDAKRVFRVNPYTEDYEVLSQGVISSPNGIVFNVDNTRLFVAGFSGAKKIYAFDVDEDGDVGPAYEWATGVGTGWLDGIGVDICGNLYIADYGSTKILKFPPDGSSYKTIAQGSGGQYLPNMQWGSGYGGWDPMKIYLPDGWNKGVFEVDLQVLGAPVPYPPKPD